jgi:ribosome biogenesis GTPase
MPLPDSGVVIKRTRSFYYVDVGEASPRLCRIRGNLFESSKYDQRVAVGDHVRIDLNASEDAGWILEILPRHTKLSRRSREGETEQILVTNAEVLMIVAALRRPEFRSGMVDRMIVAALRGGLRPLLVLNKCDLASEEIWAPIREVYESLGYEVLPTSATQAIGLQELRDRLQGKTTVLSGHSGVGKSSLIKALYPDWSIRVGDVNRKVGKGRHTTVLAEMFALPESGYLVDTPGIRELEPFGVTRETLGQYFVEFTPFEGQCRFARCSHQHEPDCAVKEALGSGAILQRRYESFVALWESLEA